LSPREQKCGILAFDFQFASDFYNRFLSPAKRVTDFSPRHRPSIFRVQSACCLDGTGEVRQRLLIAFEGMPGLPTATQCPGVIRLQLDGTGEVRQRLLMPFKGLPRLPTAT